jgi:hypothetical protein
MQIREEVRLSGTSWRPSFLSSLPEAVPVPDLDAGLGQFGMVLLECCATVHEAWCDAKPQVSTGM